MSVDTSKENGANGMSLSNGTDYDNNVEARQDHEFRETNTDSPTLGQSEDDDEMAGLPVDRGWAWVILAGAVFQAVIYGSMTKALGILFIEFQRRFQSSASETSIVSSMQFLTVSFSSLFVLMVMLRKASARSSVMIGAIVNSTGYVITAFATDIRVLYFSFGILGGLAISMMFFPIIATVNQYFKKHRALANSAMMSGTSLGSLISAPVITSLFEEFGYTGALIMVAGIFLNVLVTAALLRPIESFKKKQCINPITEKCPGNDDMALYKDDTHTECTDHQTALPPEGSLKMRALLCQEEGKPFLPEHKSLSLDMLRQRTTSQSSVGSSHRMSGLLDSISRSRIALYASTELINGSMIDIPSHHSTHKHTGLSTDNKRPMMARVLSIARRGVAIFTNRKSVIRNPVLLAYLGMAFFELPASMMVPVYIAPYANDLGIPTKKIALLYTVAGAIDVVSRLSAGVIADRKWVRHTTLIALSTIVIGTISHLIRFFKTFPMMMVFAILTGLCSGTYTSLFGAVLADVIGQKQFKSALGWAGVVHGIGISVIFAVTGLLRDIAGAYIPPFHLVGVLAYVGSGAALLLPVVKKWHDRKGKQGAV